MIYDVIEKIEFSANGLRITHTFEVGDTIDSDNVPPRLIHVFTKDTPRPFIIPEGTEPLPPPPILPEEDIVEYMGMVEDAFTAVEERQKGKEIINEKIKPGKKGKDKTTKKKKTKRASK